MKLKIKKSQNGKWKVITPSGTIVVHTFNQATELASDILEHKRIHKGGKL